MKPNVPQLQPTVYIGALPELARTLRRPSLAKLRCRIGPPAFDEVVRTGTAALPVKQSR
jgi:hypothetical protein